MPTNHFGDSFNILDNIIVPEAYNHEARHFEKLCSRRIRRSGVEMMAAIKFDDDSALKADKIENEITKRMLTTEFATFQLATFQSQPQCVLGLGGLVAQNPLQIAGAIAIPCLPFHG